MTSDEFFYKVVKRVRGVRRVKAICLVLGVKGVRGVKVIYCVLGVRTVCSAINVRLYKTFCANGDKVLLPAHQKNQPEQTFLVRSG